MRQVQQTDKQIRNADEQQILIVEIPPAVPGHHENTAGDDNGKNFGKAMKQQVIIATAGVKPGQQQKPRKSGNRFTHYRSIPDASS